MIGMLATSATFAVGAIALYLSKYTCRFANSFNIVACTFKCKTHIL